MIILGHSGHITHFQAGQVVDGAGQNSFRNLLSKSFPLVYVENILNKHPFLDLGPMFVWGSKRLRHVFFFGGGGRGGGGGGLFKISFPWAFQLCKTQPYFTLNKHPFLVILDPGPTFGWDRK